MQAVFLQDEQKVKSFVETVSRPRLTRYMTEAGGDIKLALRLYHWNSQLSQALYLPLQSWEVGLRNRMNSFLIWKYHSKWFEDQRALRAFSKAENEKLGKTILRQQQNRKSLPTADQIVADLSAGFWVALLSSRYDVPFVWRYNVSGRIFTNDAAIDREGASRMCSTLLDLRNRVAHHEPIFHLDHIVAPAVSEAASFSSSEVILPLGRITGSLSYPSNRRQAPGRSPRASRLHDSKRGTRTTIL